ncbi:uncharacterized protein CXorf38 homolog isoform X2 [Ascaphus truei]|uniref:uncharacterized protein CXorf38 homolog isoform X2 n=1 Tax=Ascaphus truei TaxID=8439 RepID=UPI003F5A6DE2
MAQSGLMQRMNNPEYKNWMRGGQCLLLLNSSLQGFIAAEMKTFHRQLACKIPARQGSRCQCRAKGKQFQPGCSVCAEWKRQILDHHTNRNGEIHWGNCNPSHWTTNYFEVAKAYMPRGHADKQGPHKCDIAALLNLINGCCHFRSSNLPNVREVLSSDWAVEDLDQFEVDGAIRYQSYCLVSPVYGIEKQLIQELLQEIYLQIEEQGTLSEKDLDNVQKMKNFLSGHKDLQLTLRADIRRLEFLERNTFSSLELKGAMEQDEDVPMEPRKVVTMQE